MSPREKRKKGEEEKNKLTQLVVACFGLVSACGELRKYPDVSEIFPAVNQKGKYQH